MDTKILNHSRTYQPLMEKIIGAILTFVVFVSTSLIVFSLNNNSVSAARFGEIPPNLSQDMLNLKSMQLGPNDQTSEFPPTEEQFPPSEGEMTMPDQEPAQPIEKYRVNVRFDQITVHNDHEGALSGDGEYLLNAYVHGTRVDLTKLSQWRDAGLGDVSSGETVKFRPGNLMTVNLDSYVPLTIFTVGSEDDGCQKGVLPATVRNLIESKVANETRGNASKAAGAAIGGYYGGPAGAKIGAEIGPELRKYSAWLGNRIESFVACKVNADDKIGEIIEAFNAPGYGAGPHLVQSDLKDFTLTYTIDAQRVQ